jgi:putative sigma-54 modulation protein
MQIVIKGKQMEVTPPLRQYVERKVQRLSRLVDTDTRVEVTITEEQTRSARDRYSVQLAISHGSHPIRSEVSAVNANTALDRVLDKVMAQLGRQKDRQTSTRRHRTPPVKVLSLSRSGHLSPMEEEPGAAEEQQDDLDMVVSEESEALVEEHNEEIWSQIMEIRRVSTKPMNDQEAIAQMEALGLSFYPFFNEASNSVNVMYRLENGGYGLLVPALEV